MTARPSLTTPNPFAAGTLAHEVFNYVKEHPDAKTGNVCDHFSGPEYAVHQWHRLSISSCVARVRPMLGLKNRVRAPNQPRSSVRYADAETRARLGTPDPRTTQSPDCWVIVGNGANQRQVPALIFKTKNSAIAFMATTGLPHIPKADKWVVPESIEYESHPRHPLWARIYARYNPGCGGVDHFRLVPVFYGAPFATFDLD